MKVLLVDDEHELVSTLAERLSLGASRRTGRPVGKKR